MTSMPVTFELLSVLSFVAVALFAIWRSKFPLAHLPVYGACAVVCAFAGVTALTVLTSDFAYSLTLPIGLPWLGSHYRLDALSAFFSLVVNLGGFAASIFGLGYGRHEPAPHRVLPFYAAFLGAMNLVLLADDAFSFLFAWELMSLMSWALVVSNDRSSENLRAGYVYIVMASFGTLCLLLAFGILAGPDGAYAFSDMRASASGGTAAMLVLILVILGAGSKAGLVPLHVWLPLAHPAAPSHVSALMSGVMTKVAVYAFIRVIFDLLGPLDWRMSMLVIGLGGVTALLGVLYALMQHDLKRLLAFHTVENIGIIFVGLGLALAFRADGLMAAAALAASAALFHVFNHSLFKSLLFFGSGAVLAATGERDMERLGGLIHRMPRTSFVFLIGCAAISALPPLNGFASEWMIFQAIIASPALPQWGLRFLAPSVGAMLALAAALAAACFVKAYGVTFLGRARSERAKVASETDRISLIAMSGLAALCVFAGALPGSFIRALAPVSRMLTARTMPQVGFAKPWQPLLPFLGSHNSYSGLVVFGVVLTATLASALFVRLFANRATRHSAAWDCGYPNADPVTQYTAGSFAEPIRRVFGTLAFRAQESVVMPPPGGLEPARFEASLHDPAWDTIYNPLVNLVAYISDRMNILQYLTIRRYLAIVVSVLVLLLLVLAIWS